MGKGREDTSGLVNSLETLSARIREEVAKEEGVDWKRVREYMDQRERIIRSIGRIRSMPTREQNRIRRLLEKDKETIRKIEEMKDKVAAQMRRLGNQEAGKVLDTRG